MPTTQLSLPPPQGTVRQPCSPPPCYSDSVRPCLAGVLEAALSCQSPSLDSEDLCALSELQFSHLCMGLKLPGLPTSQGCPEDPLRLHVRGTDLPQSTVQIKGLLELLLPPDAARGPGRGPGAKLWGKSLEREEKCPSLPSRGAGTTSRKASRALGRRGQVHTTGGPVPWAQAAGESRGPEEMQTAPSQSPWPLEPETKDPVTKNSSPQTMASFLQASHDLLGNE